MEEPKTLIDGCEEVISIDKFYKDADMYWKSIPSDVNGMLGGFSNISNTDIQGSKQFLKHFIKGENERPTKTTSALDCGAGIGRVSKFLLLPIFDKVDLLEQNNNFLNKAKEYIGPKYSSKVGKLIAKGMQDIDLPRNHYDVIWIQWVTGHLIDDHFVNFLRNCKSSLTENGIIVIKDNITAGGIELDETDSSVTRSEEALKEICLAAQLSILKVDHQKNFPDGLYSVIILALR